MSGYPFPGPRAPENNPPINPQYYLPSRFTITNITFGEATTVTTAVDHNYVIGQQVRILVQPQYGANQLNERAGNVIGIPSSNQVVVDINSFGTNPFIPIPSYSLTPPQIVAIGDVNTGAVNPFGRSNTKTFIPGSFIDISPA